MFKYQLIILGTIKPIVDGITSLYYQKIEELKLQKQKLEIEKSKLNKIKSKNYKR